MSRWLREKLNGYGLPGVIGALVVTLVLAPVAYLRADLQDMREENTDLVKHVACLNAQWDLIDQRLSNIEEDVEFIRDLAIKGLLDRESK